MDLNRTIRAPSTVIKNSSHIAQSRNRLRLEPPSLRVGLPTPPLAQTSTAPASTSRIPSSRIPARPSALLKPATVLKQPQQRMIVTSSTAAPKSSATITRSGLATRDSAQSNRIPGISQASRLRPSGTATITKPKALNVATNASSIGSINSINTVDLSIFKSVEEIRGLLEQLLKLLQDQIDE